MTVLKMGGTRGKSLHSPLTVQFGTGEGKDGRKKVRGVCNDRGDEATKEQKGRGEDQQAFLQRSVKAEMELGWRDEGEAGPWWAKPV